MHRTVELHRRASLLKAHPWKQANKKKQLFKDLVEAAHIYLQFLPLFLLMHHASPRTLLVAPYLVLSPGPHIYHFTSIRSGKNKRS